MRTQKTFRRKARVNANIRLVYSLSMGGVVTIFFFLPLFVLFLFLNLQYQSFYLQIYAVWPKPKTEFERQWRWKPI